MDFVLRPMRAFDVMEVPLLHRQLHATFQSALCAPLLWPQQAHFYWADLLDQPAPTRITVRPLRPTPRRGLTLTLTRSPALSRTRTLALTLTLTLGRVVRGPLVEAPGQCLGRDLPRLARAG